MKTSRYPGYIGCVAVGFAASLLIGAAVAQTSEADTPATASEIVVPSDTTIQASQGNQETAVAAPTDTASAVVTESSPVTPSPAVQESQAVETTVPGEVSAADSATSAPEVAAAPEPPPKPRYNRDDVRWIQQRLAELGYYNGPIDGAYGRITREAIKAYQFDQELTQDGRPTPELRDFMWRNGG